MLQDICGHSRGVKGIERNLGMKVVMKEPQLLYIRYLKST